MLSLRCDAAISSFWGLELRGGKILGKLVSVRFREAVILQLSNSLEDSPSGLWRTPGTRVGFTPSGVQIPHPPPEKKPRFRKKPGLFACPAFLRCGRTFNPKVAVLVLKTSE